MARELGLAKLLGPACPERDLALALVVARACQPDSKLATTRWWASTTLGPRTWGWQAASTDDVYAAMDWLVARQGDIEAALARRHLAPGGRVLYDLSSSWVEGSCCPLARRGYSRDGKTGKAQVEYGLTCDPEGRPVAVEVFAGNTADPTRLYLGRPSGARAFRARRCGDGGRPGDDHQRPYRRAQSRRRAGLADQPARPVHRRPGRPRALCR